MRTSATHWPQELGRLVGNYSYQTFIDGGNITDPRAAFRNTEGELDIANEGVGTYRRTGHFRIIKSRRRR
ncbi:MAG: hypothetical protein ABIO36_06315 [Pyrinomonadaceae bacterium]